MSYETYNKGNIQKSDSVNTRGLQLKNRNGFEVATMVVQYWDEKLNIMLHPQLKNPTEKQVYDYEQKIMVTLYADKAKSLLKGLEKIIDKAIEENKEASVAITLSKNSNMLVVSTVLKENSLHVVTTVCRDINPETKIPNQRYSYTFIKDDEVVENYDPKTGSFSSVHEVQSEYELFKETLAEYTKLIHQANVHSDRFNDKYYRTSLIDKVTKIGSKLGVLDSGHKTGSYGSQSAFANVNNGDTDYTKTTSLADLGDVF